MGVEGKWEYRGQWGEDLCQRIERWVLRGRSWMRVGADGTGSGGGSKVGG